MSTDRIKEIETRVNAVKELFGNKFVTGVTFTGGFVSKETEECEYCELNYRLARVIEHKAPSEEFTDTFHIHEKQAVPSFGEVYTPKGESIVAVGSGGCATKEISDLVINSINDLEFLLNLVKMG